ncbi:DUF2807 domain-containing protein [Erythrobacter litoralis]|uniref:head GIN domain-containing protein n=1 Tax=Erythrobacter litoralis TaxID=39960 RepID=UPI002434AC95|nr:DUF2807 domain-containing protein [Erythrobacter litoralis]MDG6079397.1 DUF2807 domain-containing protein [Erythrobacter litoralis]
MVGVRGLRFSVLAGAALLCACGVNSHNYGGSSGVPLAELDLGGPAPSTIKLGGSDRVIVTTGEPFDIEVSGDDEAVEALRFDLDDGSLGIGRRPGTSVGTAIVRIKTPVIERLALGGSGLLEADRMAGDTAVDIAGSGTVRIARIEGEKFAVSIAGSGDLDTAGQVRELSLKIAGSGDAAMVGLHADRANISISGSGDAVFASDGEVSASIAGSGDVRVVGNARCSVSRAGSGDLVCEPAGN